ncbi:MAG: efflux RND transporter permease subunit [Paracoccaceae bacterium]
MLSGYFFRETRVIIMIVMVMIVGGLSALWTLGRQEDPTITNLFASVTTLLPGAEPGRIEELISTKIEDEVQGISDISYFSSSSFKGASVVVVAVRDTLPNEEIDRVWIELREAVARASQRFPPGTSASQIDSDGVTAFSTVIALEIHDKDVSPVIAARFAKAVEVRLRDIPSTRVVRSFGLPEEELLVSVDPFFAGSNGVSVDQVAQAIQGADGRVLAGRYVSGELNANIAVSGEISQIDNVRAIPLRSGSLDAVVRVGDVATVVRQERSPPASVGRSNGVPAILIGAVVEDGAQVDRWMRYVREDVEELKRKLPRGLELKIAFDQSTYTIERLVEVGLNMLFGMVLVALVLVFTLGWRAAIIVAVILPMVTLATLASFRFIDLPLHQMSIAGLIVSLGLVVDAAIVTTDTVRRRLIGGDKREEAASGASKRLVLPLAASTVTTILTFLPMILLPGNAGDFVSTIAIAVSIMLFWSFILAIILTAPVAAHVLRTYSGPTQRVTARTGLFFKTQRFLIRNPVFSIAISFVLPLLGFYLSTHLTPQFFPLVERNQFHISLELPSQTTVATTDALVIKADAYLAEIDGITSRYWVAGGSAPSFFYNIPSGRSNEPGYAQAMVTTRAPQDTRQILKTLQQDLTNRFPEARVVVQALAQGPPVGAPVEVLIFGPELDELRRIGAEVQGAIAALPEAAQVRGGLTGGLPQIRYQINSDAANLLSLDETAIAQQLQAGLSGTLAGSMTEGTLQIPIRVQFTQEVLENPYVINDLPILTNQSRSSVSDLPTVPLSAIASPSLEVTETLIFRSDGERMNYVQAYPQPGLLPEVLLQKALAAVEDAMIEIPQGYRLDIGGDSDERSSTVDGLLSSVLLIITLSFATLVLTFRSFRLTIGATIVAGLSAGLSLLSVSIMGFPFGINSLIGVIGSIGVSINAAIIVFTALQGNPAAAAGDVDAAAQEVVNGARHIMSTTLTTFGGFLPLLFSGGLFWPPFAAAVAGGVLFSGSLAFLFAPAYFALVHRQFGAKRKRFVPHKFDDAPSAAQYVSGLGKAFSKRAKHRLRSSA